jgi:hypothetical protein
LGETQEQVFAILGLPTRRSHDAKAGWDSLVYDYEVEKTASARQIDNARRENPNMTARDLLKNYGSYEELELIEARFVNNSLIQLEVSWSAQN